MGFFQRLTGKLADHPSASSDPNVNPSKGAQDTNSGFDDSKSHARNRIEQGQGAYHPDEQKYRAGSLTNEDAVSQATAAFKADKPAATQ